MDVGPENQVPATPPMQAGAIAIPQRESTWPTVIGTLAIVFGGGGILGGIWGSLSPLLTEMMSSFLIEGQAQAMQEWMAWTVAYSLAAAAVAVLLLIGGIRLLRRRVSSKTLLRTWAIVKMIVVVLGSVIGYRSAQAQFEAIQADPALAGAGTGIGFYEAMGAVSVVVGLLWGWALPVFILVWFARSKIIAETADWN